MINPFAPYKIGNLELKNRFARSATWDLTASESGAVTDNSVEIFRELAKGDITDLVIDYPSGQEKGAGHNQQVKQLEGFAKNLTAKRNHGKNLLN